MARSEKLCLQWNDFKENISASFGELRGDNDFTDVTLVCEDGQQVEAHKVVLASSSPFFKELLKKNSHPHPLVYMRALKSDDLVAMMDFLYFGEANVFQENLDSFLALAEELKLKGLNTNSENNITTVGADLNDLDKQIRSMITKNNVSTAQGKMATCNICGKEGPYSAMPRHVEAYHITGVSHVCEICGSIFR